ncbi:MAG: TfoX/Sxy family protein [Dehalococcoidia bacterium]|nr:TfoX/Sxy family protein [Dehalococcoidia bacterium]
MAFSTEIQSELDSYLLPWKDVSTRSMFGAMAYLVSGKMFAFIHDSKLVVKLPQADKTQAIDHVGAMPYTLGHNGQFGDWMELSLTSPDMVESTLPWVEKSYYYVQAVPKSRRRRVRRI